MSADRSITLLHLSDPQFGPRHRFDGTAPGSLFARLRDDLTDMRARHDLVADVVLVTGDLAETGKPAEFKQFRGFATALTEHLGLPRRRLAMIPGNHDINRLACEAYFKECESEDRPPTPPYWPKLRHYAAMFAEFYAGEADIAFTEAAPYTEFRYPELGLVIAGLNSTIADSHRPDDHYGFLGEPQLRHFAGRLREAADERLLRIVATHHHPIHPEGDLARQDLRDLRRFLGPYTNLVVHGHIHEDEFNWIDGPTPIPVLGVGSAGVKLAQRPEEVPNQYQWIRIFADRLEYGSRAFVPDQKRWVGDLRPHRDGEHWWQRRPLTFNNVATLSIAPTTVAASAETTLARDIASYRAAVARQLRRRILLCDLAAQGEDSDLIQGLELLTIFIPQRAVQEVPRTDRPHIAELPDAVEFVRTDAPPRSIAEIAVSEAHPWALILGTPGAGKTTLTSWIALKLCSDGEQLPGVPADLIPVRIELRLFIERWTAAHAAGKSYDFFDYLDDVHREESRPLRADALHNLADAGRLLWLFDGLDEIAHDDDRREISEMILGVRTRYKGRGLITGRLVGCRPLQPQFHDATIDCFTLLDLDDAQIAQFLDRWHALAFPGAADLAARRHDRLRRTLADSSTVRDLARNPLLLTLIALLNRGDELPRRRYKLFERAAELMLSQWETNKNLPTALATRFDLADKRRYLAELAYHMLSEAPGGSANAIEYDALLRFTAAFCTRRFQTTPETATTTARALIQHLRERNYVLGLLGGQTFGFLHKAFLEYFSASEILHRYHTHQWQFSDLDFLFRDHWEYPAWSETLILVIAAFLNEEPDQAIAFLQAVLARTNPWTLDTPPHFAALAVRCLSEGTLDTGIARAFALSLNKYIWYYLINNIVLVNSETLVEALLLSDGRWPHLSQATIPPPSTHHQQLAWRSLEGIIAGEDNKLYYYAEEWRPAENTNPFTSIVAATLRGSPEPSLREDLQRLAENPRDGAHFARLMFALRDKDALNHLIANGPPDGQAQARILLNFLEARRELLRIGLLRCGLVRRAGITVGIIEELRDGSIRFTYEPYYLAHASARPISPTLPLRTEPYDHPTLHPVFEGLLPQGWLLNIDLERYQLKPGDQFGLLLATGRDTIGALEIIPEDAP